MGKWKRKKEIYEEMMKRSKGNWSREMKKGGRGGKGR